MPISSFPRFGQPICPALLKSYLDCAVADPRKRGTIQLNELDASAWRRYSEDECRHLARLAVRALGPQRDRIGRDLGDVPLPSLPEGTTLDDIALERRTYNVMATLLRDRTTTDLQSLTVGGLLDQRGVGVKSLLDFLTAMEAVGADGAGSHVEAAAHENSAGGHASGTAPQYIARTVPRDLESQLRRCTHAPPWLTHCVLPSVPGGARLEHGGLKPRTLNALQRAGRRTFGDLAGLTIGELLSIRAFGVSSLVDLVDSVYRFSDRLPEEPRATVSCPYVEELLDHCRLSRELPSHILGSAVPALPPGIPVKHLGLRPATYNMLSAAGLAGDARQLGYLTLGDLTALRGFGRVRLVDLLKCIGRARAETGYFKMLAPKPGAEPLSSRKHSLPDTRAALRRVNDITGAAKAGTRDPRIGPLLRAIDPRLVTVGELIAESDERLAMRNTSQVVALCEQIESWNRQPYGEELLQVVLGRRQTPRNQQIVRAFFCLDGQPKRTLQVIGDEHGLTRERVRQICTPGRNPGFPQPFAPALDRLLAATADVSGSSAGKVESSLRKVKLLDANAMLDGVPRAAKALRRVSPVQVVGRGKRRLAVPGELFEPTETTRQMVARAAGKHGAASLRGVIDRSHWEGQSEPQVDVLRLAAESVDHLHWLNEQRTWYAIVQGNKARLRRRIREVLAVAGSLSVERLHTALRRDHFLQGHVPPIPELRALCQLLKLRQVDRNRVELAKPPTDPARIHRGVEAALVRLLGSDDASTLRIEQIDQMMAQEGWAYGPVRGALMWCPSIERLRPGVFALRGARARGTRAEENTTDPWTQTVRDDRIRVIWPLNETAIDAGRLNLPEAASVVSRQRSTRYKLRRLSGLDMGMIAIRNDTVEELGRALRHLDAEPGDLLAIDFELREPLAIIRIADLAVLEA